MQNCVCCTHQNLLKHVTLDSEDLAGTGAKWGNFGAPGHGCHGHGCQGLPLCEGESEDAFMRGSFITM